MTGTTDTAAAQGELVKPVPPQFPALEADATNEDIQAARIAYGEALDAYDAAMVEYAKSQPVLSIDQIRNANDLNEGPTFVEQWGGSVITRGLSRREYAESKAEARRLSNGDDAEYLEELGRQAVYRGMVEPALDEDEPMWDRHPMALKTIADAVLDKSGVGEEVAALQMALFSE
jgi:hypothetical protein